MMKTIITRLAFCITLALIALPLDTANAKSPGEINEDAAKAFEASDRTLNKVYKELTAKLDEQAQEKLKAAQRVWVQFRDAHGEFVADAGARGGRLAPLLYEEARKILTDARIKELQRAIKAQGE